MIRTMQKQKRVSINSLVEFLDDLFTLRKEQNNRKLWYRGHEDASYELRPTIGRHNTYAGKGTIFNHQQEHELLHRFRRRTYLESGRLINAGEALFVARHHGLPTRLLDWTANALFGLYFACSKKHEVPGELWAMKRFDVIVQLDALEVAKCTDEKTLFDKLSDSGSLDGTQSTANRVKLIEPLYNSVRIRAQDGAFTIQSDAKRRLDDYCGEQFEEPSLDIETLYLWDIPHNRKRRILEELNGLGITDRIVFPDLDGIAKSLWETEVLWCGHDDEANR